MRMTKVMDHAAYRRRLRKATPAELRFIIKDALEAMAAMPSNPNCGYYADEVSYAAMELKRRRL